MYANAVVQYWMQRHFIWAELDSWNVHEWLMIRSRKDDVIFTMDALYMYWIGICNIAAQKWYQVYMLLAFKGHFITMAINHSEKTVKIFLESYTIGKVGLGHILIWFWSHVLEATIQLLCLSEYELSKPKTDSEAESLSLSLAISLSLSRDFSLCLPLNRCITVASSKASATCRSLQERIFIDWY